MFRRRLTRYLFVVLLALSAFAIPTISYSQQHIVRVLYFQPTDAPPAPEKELSRLIKQIQSFFRTEMKRHDFGDKTFKIEADENGELIIHIIKGKHAGKHYEGEVFHTYFDKMAKEIPFAINNSANRAVQDDSHIFFLGGVKIVDDPRGSTWGGDGRGLETLSVAVVLSTSISNNFIHTIFYQSLRMNSRTHSDSSIMNSKIHF